MTDEAGVRRKDAVQLRKRLYIIGNRTVSLILLSLLVLDLMGCGLISRRHQSKESQIQVIALANDTGAVELMADDVVTILQACGFTDQQIFYHGADLREALLNLGGAKIMVGDRVEAIFKVQNDLVWLSSSRGTMVYDVKSGQMQLGPSPLPR